MTMILALDSTYNPSMWMDWKDAIILKVKGSIAKEFGDPNDIKRGGYSRMTGLRSEIELYPIIAIKDYVNTRFKVTPLTNNNLFIRDQYTCGYCGRVHRTEKLSRDHIVPVSKGGPNTWTNVVTACKPCNHEKGDRSVQEWNAWSEKKGLGSRELLFLPYTPSPYEKLLLQNKKVLASQMDFIRDFLPDHSRLKNLHIQ